jgi:uncharacterized protein YegL
MELIASNLKNKNPGLIINFILDQSGSMHATTTIDAFNKYINNLKKDKNAERKNTVFMTLTYFETKPQVIYVCKEISEVEELTTKTYRPGGGTALNDAIGITTTECEKAIAEWETKPSILTVILTDGEENSSKEYGGFEGQKKIAELIERKEKEGNWTFVFLSEKPQVAAQEQARSLGLCSANVESFEGGMLDSIDNLSSATCCFAKKACESNIAYSTNAFFDFANKDLFNENATNKKGTKNDSK